MSSNAQMAADGATARPAEAGPTRLTAPTFSFSLARWIGPAVPVSLLAVDGRQLGWLADASGAIRAQPSPMSSSFKAQQVPEHLLLWKTVQLPPLPAEAVKGALALQVRALSPFPPDETVWAHVARSAQPVASFELVLASRPQLEAWLNEAQPDAQVRDALELWALSERMPSAAPAVLPGFAEKRRLNALRLRQWGMWALSASFLLVLAAGVLSPSVQLYQRAQQAAAAHSQVREQARPALAAREAYQRTTERWTALHEQVGATMDAVRLLEALTRKLPDDAFLSRIQVEGTKVTLTGQAANAAALMDQLGAEPGFSAVRAPSPATKVPNAAQERFVIELQAEPKVFSLNSAPEPVAAAATDKTTEVRP